MPQQQGLVADDGRHIAIPGVGAERHAQDTIAELDTLHICALGYLSFPKTRTA